MRAGASRPAPLAIRCRRRSLWGDHRERVVDERVRDRVEDVTAEVQRVRTE
jgi:hypothetical protein